LDNLTSGLIGALIGALIGVGGAFLIQWNETRKDLRAAARGVFLEVAANSAALSVASKTGAYVPLSSTNWHSSQHRLARGLSPQSLVTVATFYMRVDAMRAAGLPLGGGSSAKVQSFASAALTRADPAAIALEQKGWWPWERKAMRSALQELSADQ
jgi:hypothetical protein